MFCNIQLEGNLGIYFKLAEYSTFFAHYLLKFST